MHFDNKVVTKCVRRDLLQNGSAAVATGPLPAEDVIGVDLEVLVLCAECLDVGAEGGDVFWFRLWSVAVYEVVDVADVRIGPLKCRPIHWVHGIDNWWFRFSPRAAVGSVSPVRVMNCPDSVNWTAGHCVGVVMFGPGAVFDGVVEFLQDFEPPRLLPDWFWSSFEPLQCRVVGTDEELPAEKVLSEFLDEGDQC